METSHASAIAGRQSDVDRRHKTLFSKLQDNVDRGAPFTASALAELRLYGLPSELPGVYSDPEQGKSQVSTASAAALAFISANSIAYK
jgi:hypothetical protein